jgi:Cu/Zn superoxide dismutase
MTLFTRTTLAALTTAMLLAGCQASGQVAVTPVASPTPAGEIGVTTSFKATGNNTSANGTSSITLSPDAKSLMISATANGLSGAVTAAHIHRADAPGGTGAVVKGLTLNGNTATGTWSLTDASQPFDVNALAALRAGQLYVNFHTAANPDGELRGDLSIK